DVVAVEDLQLLHLSVHFTLLVVDVDVDDVDRAGLRAELARDAAVVAELEHAAESIRGLEPLFRIPHRDLRLEQLADGGLQPLEQIEQQEAIRPSRFRMLNLHGPPCATPPDAPV